MRFLIGKSGAGVTPRADDQMSGKVRNRVLFQSRRFSVYLVHYSAGHSIMPHLDMVSEGRLYKLNCVLVKPRAGGEFSCERTIFDLFGRERVHAI